MNLLKVYVSNITTHNCYQYHKGIYIHSLIADIDCEGHKEKQVKLTITDNGDQSIINKGYYFG